VPGCAKRQAEVQPMSYRPQQAASCFFILLGTAAFMEEGQKVWSFEPGGKSTVELLWPLPNPLNFLEKVCFSLLLSGTQPWFRPGVSLLIKFKEPDNCRVCPLRSDQAMQCQQVSCVRHY